MTTFIEKILINFLEYRNSFHPYLINKLTIPDTLIEDQVKQKNPNYFLISRNFRRFKKKRKLYIYVGKVVFIKVQTWFIVLVYTFKPKKIKIVRRKKVISIKTPITNNYLNYYLGARLSSNDYNSNYFF
jgi:hypothetical protein